MKNLLVYISPDKKFSEECEVLARVQIDNSISLGWKKEDILFITNYEYEYNGVRAVLVGDENYYAPRPRSIKTAIIPVLIEQGIIEEGNLYWNHDFDAYQLNAIKENELGLEGADVGLTDYGWRERWCMGSYFFKHSSKDIFQSAKDIIYKNIEDEDAIMELTKDGNIGARCRRLNVTYNFGMRNVESNYGRADKPLKVVHFHPHYKWVKTLDIFMYGRNGLGVPLINKRLTEIFNYHGIQ